jgi:hypothetical protein
MLSAGGSAQSGLLVPSALLPGWLWDVLREHGTVTAGPNGQVAIEVSDMCMWLSIHVFGHSFSPCMHLFMASAKLTHYRRHRRSKCVAVRV